MRCVVDVGDARHTIPYSDTVATDRPQLGLLCGDCAVRKEDASSISHIVDVPKTTRIIFFIEMCASNNSMKSNNMRREKNGDVSQQKYAHISICIIACRELL